MLNGLIRVASCTPKIRVSDTVFNAQSIIQCVKEASDKNISILAFPELCITGYSCADLFLQQHLRLSASLALLDIVEQTKKYPILFTVGLPLAHNTKLYNCAAVICMGKILGFVPKKNIPNFAEFYERRHFSRGPEMGQVMFDGKYYPFGTNQIFQCLNIPSLKVAAEICEDLFVPSPPSSFHATHGATVIMNLSASNETLTKAQFRRELVNVQSARSICAYIYSNAGFSESTTDIVFSGHSLISENGRLITESSMFSHSMIYADIDLDLLIQDRLRQSTFPDTICSHQEIPYKHIDFNLPAATFETIRCISPTPFVPSDYIERSKRCADIINIQAHGFARRLSHTGAKSVIIGVSGGLDSTLAFLVTVKAFDILKLNHNAIFAISMPGYGTTTRTKDNAQKLAEYYGAHYKSIPIQRAVDIHFKDIEHNSSVHDITFENAQARERTQILMDLANKNNGLVVGTGYLSELALGWATYNGDHMSMYAVNASIPKTLIKDLVKYLAEEADDALTIILNDIISTPPSPELLPHKNDQITQITEDIVGPYILHDFFLYYVMRYGFPPAKILYFAEIAFQDIFDRQTIIRWMKVFYTRFFSQQFKRSCMPDGPKVGSVSLSPRGDWRMPSDACAQDWIASIDKL